MAENMEITFLIKVMNGGGAERVVSVLSNALSEKGYSVTLILTHQKISDAKLDTLNNKINVVSLDDCVKSDKETSFGAKVSMLKGRFEGKVSRLILRKESPKGLIDKYLARNYTKVKWLREYMKSHRKATMIAFLYDSIFLSLFARTSENKLIISERGDPEQSRASKTTMAFLHSMFKEADNIVFQSPDVQNWYKENTGVKGKVIFNPIKENLPERFKGIRKKKIVNFCRISEQKNLELLVNAFSMLLKEHTDYELYIYGDAVGNGAEGYLEHIENLIVEKGLKEKVQILPGRLDIHEEINDYAMFVSSSDFEGMSNSMLEAMAMGMPVVCTDCPAGGARAVIEDKTNGLLVPVGNEIEMYSAMKKIIEEPDFAEILSKNAEKIREEQSIENILKQWMEIING